MIRRENQCLRAFSRVMQMSCSDWVATLSCAKLLYQQQIRRGPSRVAARIGPEGGCRAANGAMRDAALTSSRRAQRLLRDSTLMSSATFWR